ncbi:uncharacterized protein LOC125373362 isoform X2 [Haliotis rufescens]|uniref:uncharacterized protein LOC125373362 isoform X2 n=1 Tax=Haliotis rufescens TaxID=6454 RepID=UPI00201F5AB4|nr:uncharacterized protein LOC125373362 isoform X2 [Haliotis rufescens]
MNYWSTITCVFHMLQVAHAGITHTSKACYGSGRLPCVRHDISCNNTQKIDIQDAYYTNNTECTINGLSECNVNPDNVTESGKHSFFSTAEMSSLVKACSTSCVYIAPRRNENLAFSVVRYECNEASPHISTSTQTVDRGGQTPAVVGGVVTTILILIVIALTLVWYLRKRRRKTNRSKKTITPSKDVKTDFTDNLAGNSPQSNYHEIDELKTNSRSNDYDYATADAFDIAPDQKNYLTIESVTKPNTNQNSAPSATEDDYDHIGDKPSALTSNYDTTASVAQSAGTAAQSREDNYGYNLLQKETNTKTVQNDYDTTASTAKAVARLHGSNKTDENDYDHFPGSNSKSETLSSSHGGKVRDRSDDYAFAGPMS